MAIRAGNSISPAELEKMSPAEKTAMKAGRDENRMVEYVEWIAGGGYDDEPKWFHSRIIHNNIKTKEVRSPEMVYSFLKEIPKPARTNIRFFYATTPTDISPSIGNFDPTSGKYKEIRFDQLGKFNSTLSEIFGNPGSDGGKGRYVARAVAKVLQNPDSLVNVPFTSDLGFQHLRKLDVAKQAIGVYGNWTTKWKEGEDQIIVLTAQHKNLRRTRTGK